MKAQAIYLIMGFFATQLFFMNCSNEFNPAQVSNSTSSSSNSNNSNSPSTFVCARQNVNFSPPTGSLIFDDFNYVADRNDISARTAFMAHGWTGIKSNQTDPTRNPRGHLYTENGWLAIESHANTFTYQTDFWLQLGDESNTNLNAIPGRLRIEFDYQVDPNSRFDRHDKFLYPGRGPYPQTARRDSQGNPILDAQGNQIYTYLWLLGTSTSSVETNGGPTIELGPGADLFLFLRPPHADFTAASEYPTNKDKLGPNLNTSVRLSPGTVHHVVLQIDTSTQSGRFEMWIDGVKTHEWIDGVTPNFSWRIPASMVGGHSIMRVPTTLSGGESKSCLDNFWMGTY